MEGISNYYNCFGENIASSVDWESIYYTVRGDIYNPNKWCVEVVIGDKITAVGRYAFYGLIAMERVTVKGKNTVITDGEIPNNVIICAQSDSIAKLYAQKTEILSKNWKLRFKNCPDSSSFRHVYLVVNLEVFKMKHEQPIVHRVIPSAEGGYALSTELNGDFKVIFNLFRGCLNRTAPVNFKQQINT